MTDFALIFSVQVGTPIMVGAFLLALHWLQKRMGEWLSILVALGVGFSVAYAVEIASWAITGARTGELVLVWVSSDRLAEEVLP